MSSDAIGVQHSSFEDTVLGALITPATLLPEQYADGLRTYELSPEKRLYLAILEDAIDCWLRGGKLPIGTMTRRRAEEAERWIWPDDEIVSTISFSDCCEAFGILPEWLRTKLETKRHQRPMKLRGPGHPVAGVRAMLGLASKECQQSYGVNRADTSSAD